MAIEDVLLLNLGVWGGFLQATRQRWAKAAMDARVPPLPGPPPVPQYTLDNLFETLREQFVDNWNVLSELTRFSGFPVTPTVVIRIIRSAGGSADGSVYVRQRLTGLVRADYRFSDLERIGNPADKIPAANLDVSLPPAAAGGEYDFDGTAMVILSTAPAVDGIYRGLILIKVPENPTPEPLTWVVVIAEP